MVGVDPEKGYSPVTDFPSLATFIASDEDRSTSIYKRFQRLSARNLLHLQSELMELEAQQDEYDAEVASLDLEAKKSLRNWADLKDRALKPIDTRETRGLSLAIEIKEKLKEYS